MKNPKSIKQTQAMAWISEIETAKSLEDLCESEATHGNSEKLDSQIAGGFEKSSTETFAREFSKKSNMHNRAVDLLQGDKPHA